jgi:hypothetical protein
MIYAFQLAGLQMKRRILAAVHLGAAPLLAALIGRGKNAFCRLGPDAALTHSGVFSAKPLARNSVAIVIQPRETTFSQVERGLRTVSHFLAVAFEATRSLGLGDPPSQTKIPVSGASLAGNQLSALAARRVSAATLENQPASVPTATMSQLSATSGFA